MTTPSIDVHSHAVPASYFKALETLGISPVDEDGFPTPSWTEEDHLAFMEETGQEFCVLSISSPHINRGDNALSASLARTINDDVAAICKRHPDKLGFATLLPLPGVQESIDEAKRGFEELGAIGVKVPSNANGVYLGDPSLDPLFEMLDDYHAVVTIHPTRPSASPAGVFTEGPAPLFEFIVDTTRAVLNMMANGVIERYPHVRIIVPHCGSFLPPIAHRLVGLSRILVPQGRMQQIDVMGNLKSLYWDLAGNAEPVMLESLMKIADPSHLLYGSDTPYTPTKAILQAKEQLEADPKLTPYIEDVFHDNAARLYGLE